MENVSEELQNVFPFAYIYFRGEKFEINQRKIAGINHQIQISYYRNFTLDNMAASIVIFFLSLSFPLTKYCIQFSSAASAVILPSSISPKNKKRTRIICHENSLPCLHRTLRHFILFPNSRTIYLAAINGARGVKYYFSLGASFLFYYDYHKTWGSDAEGLTFAWQNYSVISKTQNIGERYH